MKTQKRTHWSYSVYYNDSRSSCCSSAETLETALAKAFSDATYYLGIGYPDVFIGLTEICPVCSNSGLVWRGVRKPRVKCTECKGRIPDRSIGPITVRFSNCLSGHLETCSADGLIATEMSRESAAVEREGAQSC